MLHTIHKISISILIPLVYSILYTLVHCNMESVLHYYTSLAKITISGQRFRTRSHVTRRARIRRGTLVLVVHKNSFLCSECVQDYITQQSCALPISSKKDSGRTIQDPTDVSMKTIQYHSSNVKFWSPRRPYLSEDNGNFIANGQF